MRLKEPIERLVIEASESRRKYGPYNSPHEALGVLVEEMKEIIDTIHANDHEQMRTEAMQIAAVALRLAAEKTTLEKKKVI